MVSRLGITLGVLQVLLPRRRFESATGLAHEGRSVREVGIMIHPSIVSGKHAVRRSTMLLLLLLMVMLLLLLLMLGIHDAAVGMMMLVLRWRLGMVMIESVFVFSLDEDAVVALLANDDPRGQIVAQQKILENFTQLR